MSAPFFLEIPPGIVKSTSNLSAKGRWTDGDKVRFTNGKAEKWGGWELYIDEQLDGLARGGYGWTTAANIDLLAFGTFRKIYSVSSELQDITPLRDSGTLANNPFATTSGLPTVTVHDTAHGVEVDAWVHFSGATAVTGITINGPYTVTSVTDADHYVITHTSNASGTSAGGGGAAVAYEYEINPGQQSTVYGLGWGAGGWGEDFWDEPREGSTLAIDMRFWSICNYGSELLVNPTNGTIYLWDEPAGDARAEALSGAPASVRYTFVTAERYILALGTSSPMTVDWPDILDPTDWTPSEANTANTRVLQDGNKLMAGVVFNDAVNLLWSDNAIFLAQYLVGSDEIYDISVIKTNAGLVAQAGFCVTPLGVLWLSGTTVYLYNGAVQEAPNFSDVRDWFFSEFRRDRAHKVAMVYNAKKNEIQLHYTSNVVGENCCYLACSLDTWSWAPGTMDDDLGHTAMAVRRNPTKAIFATHVDGYIYEHEAGVDADGAAMESYLESGILALANGAYDMDILGYQPDFERQTGDLTLDVKCYDRPRDEQSDDTVDSGQFTIAEIDSYTDILLGGRYAKHRITSNVIGGDWRLGIGLFEIGQGGG